MLFVFHLVSSEALHNILYPRAHENHTIKNRTQQCCAMLFVFHLASSEALHNILYPRAHENSCSADKQGYFRRNCKPFHCVKS